MAQIKYSVDTIPKIPDAEIVILQAKWHKNYSDVMLEKCLNALRATDCKKPAVHVLPGCLELPLAAYSLAKLNSKIDAFIVFGALIKGQTFHFEMVLEQCNAGLSKVMFDFEIPIINEIIPATKESQLISRCSDDDKNKGLEAAIAAAEIISWRRNNL